LEKAVFSNTRFTVPAKPDFIPYREYIGSSLEILDVESTNSTIIFQSPRSLQAPNWMKNGKSLIYNSEGLLYKFDLASAKTEVINTGMSIAIIMITLFLLMERCWPLVITVERIVISQLFSQFQ
jgi:hypothetical protein